MSVTRLRFFAMGCSAFVALGLLLASAASSDPPLRIPAQVVSVRVLPINHVLKRGALNVVAVHPGLAFRVTIRSTSSVARNLIVRLTIPRVIRTGTPDVKPVVERKTLRLARNQWKAVTFTNIGHVQFVVRTPLKVNLETRTGKNIQVVTDVYPVIFSLG